jgi:hypothetical protein
MLRIFKRIQSDLQAAKVSIGQINSSQQTIYLDKKPKKLVEKLQNFVVRHCKSLNIPGESLLIIELHNH